MNLMYLSLLIVLLSPVNAFRKSFSVSRTYTNINVKNLIFDYPEPGERRNYPKPDFESTSLAQREARELSNSFNYGLNQNKQLNVAIVGGGLSGKHILQCKTNFSDFVSISAI